MAIWKLPFSLENISVSHVNRNLGETFFSQNFNLYGKRKCFLQKIAEFRPLEIRLPEVLESWNFVKIILGAQSESGVHFIPRLTIKDVRNRSAIMVCEIKFGAKIFPAYSPLDMKVKQQLQSGGNVSLYMATITRCDLSPWFFCIDATLLCEFESDKILIDEFE